jgi:serine-type D-Ala-D-Ala carboxypeptidase (penicillin-binding protein 5/6)
VCLFLKKLIVLIIVFITTFTMESRGFAHHQEQINIISEAAVVMDSETGAILFSKNASEKMYPASLTKIATAIYAIENGNQEDLVTVSKNAVSADGTRVYLDEGEAVSLHHLIQGMLINSGNDAAIAIAEHIDGSVEQFAENLNKYLKKKIGVTSTHFVNPNGLFDENHYTTAEDLAKITSYAMKNPVFKEIFGTKELQWDGQSWDTTLITHHQMLKGEIPYNGITGGKTGFVNESKQTLATTADNGQIKLTAILLKADYKREIYNDTKQVLDFGFQNFKTVYLPENKTFTLKDKDFKLLKSQLISEPVNGVHYEVTNNGILQIQTIDHETIQTIQLDPIEKVLADPHVSDDSETNEPFIKMNTLYGTLAALAALALYGVAKKYRKQKRG